MYIPPTGHHLNIIKRSSFLISRKWKPYTVVSFTSDRVIPGEETPMPTEHEEADFYKHREVLYRPKKEQIPSTELLLHF